jgi:nicotinamidase-related amidase
MAWYAYFAGERKPIAGELARWGEPGRAAVVSIDLHRGHLDPDPACPCPVPRARELVPQVDAFHRAARGLGIPVIHVHTVLRADGADERRYPASWRFTFPMTVGPLGNHWEHAKAGTRWTELLTTVESTDYVVSSKKRLSAFYPTELELLLRNLGRDVVVLNGTMTDCCVLNTAFDAANRDFRVIVAQDLVRGFSPQLEAAALAIISLHIGLVVDSEDLLAWWQSQTSFRSLP